MNIVFLDHVFLYNILSLSGGGGPFHPSVPSSKFLIPEEEDDGRGGGRRRMAATIVYPNDYVISGACSRACWW
jgi:hypothetical protein